MIEDAEGNAGFSLVRTSLLNFKSRPEQLVQMPNARAEIRCLVSILTLRGKRDFFFFSLLCDTLKFLGWAIGVRDAYIAHPSSRFLRD